MVLSWVTDPKFKPYHAQGVDMGKLSSHNRDNLKCFAKKVIKDLDRHKPWVLKDPRMLLFADFWIKQVLLHSSSARQPGQLSFCNDEHVLLLQACMHAVSYLVHSAVERLLVTGPKRVMV